MKKGLMEDVLESKFLVCLSSMQHGKIFDPNGLMMEFFIGFYELLKKYMLLVVK